MADKQGNRRTPKLDGLVVHHRMQAQDEEALRRAVTERVNQILAQQGCEGL